MVDEQEFVENISGDVIKENNTYVKNILKYFCCNDDLIVAQNVIAIQKKKFTFQGIHY